MGVSHTWMAVGAALVASCGGPTTQSVEPSPCPGARVPEAIGVWQTANSDESFVYDGCTVRYTNDLTQEPEMFAGLRNVALRFVADVREFADPFPYFRAPAEWRDDELWAVSLLGENQIAHWEYGRFWRRRPLRELSRVTRPEALTPKSRRLLDVETVVPTEAELAARHGVEMPPAGTPRPGLIQSIMCPTGDCD